MTELSAISLSLLFVSSISLTRIPIGSSKRLLPSIPTSSLSSPITFIPKVLSPIACPRLAAIEAASSLDRAPLAIAVANWFFVEATIFSLLVPALTEAIKPSRSGLAPSLCKNRFPNVSFPD